MNVYRETTWDKVKVGDTVLLAYPFDKIIKVQITEHSVIEDGNKLIAQAEFVHDRVMSRTTASADETVYVKSQF